MSPVLRLARQEGGELLLSGRGLSWLIAMTAALSTFALLLVSDTELGLLDNAQVVYDMAGIVTALGALLAVIVGSDSIAGERERRSLVPLLLIPVPRATILLGKLSGQVVAWATLYALAVPYLWAVGSTGQNLAAALAILVLLGTPVVLGFGCLALGLGARLETARASLMSGLILLMLSASPLLLGPSLRQSALGRGFDAVNPFSAALNAYDAVVIDSQSIAAQAVRLAVALVWLLLTFWFARGAIRRVSR